MLGRPSCRGTLAVVTTTLLAGLLPSDSASASAQYSATILLETSVTPPPGVGVMVMPGPVDTNVSPPIGDATPVAGANASQTTPFGMQTFAEAFGIANPPPFSFATSSATATGTIVLTNPTSMAILVPLTVSWGATLSALTEDLGEIASASITWEVTFAGVHIFGDSLMLNASDGTGFAQSVSSTDMINLALQPNSTETVAVTQTATGLAEVVPEPSSLSMASLASVGLLGSTWPWRRRSA